MLIRAVKGLMKSVCLKQTKMIMLKQHYYPLVCYTPHYSFFFNSKEEKERIRKKEEIDKLYNSINESENEDDQMILLREVITLREEIQFITNRKCILLQLDKVDYARYLIESQVEENYIVHDVLSQDFLNNISYTEVDLDKQPDDFQDYLFHNLRAGLMPLKFIKQYEGTNNDKDVEEWLKMFLESSIYTKDYLLNHFEEIGNEEGFEVKEQVLCQHYLNLVIYYEMLGRLLLDQDKIQEGIDSFEDALQANKEQSVYMEILRNHDNPDVANEAEDIKNRVLGKYADIFNQLGQIQYTLLKNKQESRPYFERASELYLQVYGKNSSQYALACCITALTYQDSDIEKCEELLKEQYEYIQSFTKQDQQDIKQDLVYLEIGMYYFTILEKRNKATQELLDEIETLRQYTFTDNVDLILEFSIAAINYLRRMEGNTFDPFIIYFDEAYEMIFTYLDFTEADNQTIIFLKILEELELIMKNQNDVLEIKDQKEKFEELLKYKLI